jgi:hypothetical protein
MAKTVKSWLTQGMFVGILAALLWSTCNAGAIKETFHRALRSLDDPRPGVKHVPTAEELKAAAESAKRRKAD